MAMDSCVALSYIEGHDGVYSLMFSMLENDAMRSLVLSARVKLVDEVFPRLASVCSRHTPTKITAAQILGLILSNSSSSFCANVLPLDVLGKQCEEALTYTNLKLLLSVCCRLLPHMEMQETGNRSGSSSSSSSSSNASYRSVVDEESKSKVEEVVKTLREKLLELRTSSSSSSSSSSSHESGVAGGSYNYGRSTRLTSDPLLDVWLRALWILKVSGPQCDDIANRISKLFAPTCSSSSNTATSGDDADATVSDLEQCMRSDVRLLIDARTCLEEALEAKAQSEHAAAVAAASSNKKQEKPDNGTIEIEPGALWPLLLLAEAFSVERVFTECTSRLHLLLCVDYNSCQSEVVERRLPLAVYEQLCSQAVADKISVKLATYFHQQHGPLPIDVQQQGQARGEEKKETPPPPPSFPPLLPHQSMQQQQQQQQQQQPEVEDVGGKKMVAFANMQDEKQKKKKQQETVVVQEERIEEAEDRDALIARAAQEVMRRVAAQKSLASAPPGAATASTSGSTSEATLASSIAFQQFPPPPPPPLPTLLLPQQLQQQQQQVNHHHQQQQRPAAAEECASLDTSFSDVLPEPYPYPGHPFEKELAGLRAIERENEKKRRQEEAIRERERELEQLRAREEVMSSSSMSPRVSTYDPMSSPLAPGSMRSGTKNVVSENAADTRAERQGRSSIGSSQGSGESKRDRSGGGGESSCYDRQGHYIGDKGRKAQDPYTSPSFLLEAQFQPSSSTPKNRERDSLMNSSSTFIKAGGDKKFPTPAPFGSSSTTHRLEVPVTSAGSLSSSSFPLVGLNETTSSSSCQRQQTKTFLDVSPETSRELAMARIRDAKRLEKREQSEQAARESLRISRLRTLELEASMARLGYTTTGKRHSGTEKRPMSAPRGGASTTLSSSRFAAPAEHEHAWSEGRIAEAELARRRAAARVRSRKMEMETAKEREAAERRKKLQEKWKRRDAQIAHFMGRQMATDDQHAHLDSFQRARTSQQGPWVAMPSFFPTAESGLAASRKSWSGHEGGGGNSRDRQVLFSPDSLGGSSFYQTPLSRSSLDGARNYYSMDSLAAVGRAPHQLAEEDDDEDDDDYYSQQRGPAFSRFQGFDPPPPPTSFMMEQQQQMSLPTSPDSIAAASSVPKQSPASTSLASAQPSAPSGEETVCLHVLRAWGLVEGLGGCNPYVVLDWGRLGRGATQAVQHTTTPTFSATLRFRSPLRKGTEEVAMQAVLDEFEPDGESQVVWVRGEQCTILAPPLKVFVYSRNSSVSDDLLGEAEVNPEILIAEEEGGSFLVDLFDKKRKSAGLLEIKLDL